MFKGEGLRDSSKRQKEAQTRKPLRFLFFVSAMCSLHPWGACMHVCLGNLAGNQDGKLQARLIMCDVLSFTEEMLSSISKRKYKQ